MIDALTMEDHLMTMGHQWPKAKAQELVAYSKSGEHFKYIEFVKKLYKTGGKKGKKGKGKKKGKKK
jgi:hypothetical protein